MTLKIDQTAYSSGGYSAKETEAFFQGKNIQLEADLKEYEVMLVTKTKEINALLTECKEYHNAVIREIFEAYDNLLDGMGYGIDDFKLSAWQWVEELKQKYGGEVPITEPKTGYIGLPKNWQGRILGGK